jgi:cytochrome c peroxidase
MLETAKTTFKSAALMVVICSVAFKAGTSKPLQRHNHGHATNWTKRYEFQVPLGLSQALWRRRIPTTNPITTEKVALGRALYFDKRLSVDRTVSCATCHDPAHAFTDHETVAVGVGPRTGFRNTPTILNAMFSDRLFWDGRATSLEDQVVQPLTNPFEMGMGNGDAVVERIKAIPEYRLKFKRIFRDQDITLQNVIKAIATFERTQLSGNSPFDRFIAGDRSALTEPQRRGWYLFRGKAGCIACHTFSSASPFFTDFVFHNTGVFTKGTALAELLKLKLSESIFPDQPIPIATTQTEPAITALSHANGFSELGRYLVTKQAKDLGAFKTPSLRDIELTSPYMHNGSIKTLIDVVQFYNRGGNPTDNLDRQIQPLHLTEIEVNEIVEFMRTLTSDDVLRQCQASRPQSRTR